MNNIRFVIITKRFLHTLVILLLTYSATSQNVLIRELNVTDNADFTNRSEVLSVHPIAIAKDALFSEDTLFRIELNNNEYNISKKYLKIRDANSFSFYATNNNNTLLLSFLEEDIQGVLTLDNDVYSIETHSNKYYLVKLNHDVMHENCDNLEYSGNQTLDDDYFQEDESPNPENLEIDRSENRYHDGSGDIKVLVLYTPAAENSVSNIYNTALLAEEESNLSFANSGVNCNLELVYIGKTNYYEISSSIDKIRFKETNDGYLDEVHTLRDKYAADVCVLLVNYNNGMCGEAYTIKAQSDEAFCVVNVQCATGYYSFIHEIGHLLGCRHDYGQDPANSPYKFGHGYVYPNGGWRTIMAYNTHCNGCTRLPYWSNPNITYNGVPMGTTDKCNNTRVWNIRYGEVGSFKNVSSNVVITTNTLPGSLDYGFIEACTHVETSGSVNLHDGQEVTVKAGNEIVFSNGFEASVGSELHAYISQTSTTSFRFAPTSLLLEVSPVKQMDNNIIERGVIIYPNPTKNHLYIQGTGADKPMLINILDMFGRVVMGGLKVDASSTVVDISQLSSGVYFIDIEFTDRMERYKIIKNK